MIPSIPQLAFALETTRCEAPHRASVLVDERRWYGLSLDHRSFFDALADEWLRPAPGLSGRLLSRAGFPQSVSQNTTEEQPRSTKLITLRARVDLSAEPDREVWALREGSWTRARLAELTDTDAYLWWPGPLSTHAIIRVSVGSQEERARLRGIARHVSNLTVPEFEVSAPSSTAVDGEPLPPNPKTIQGVEFGPNYDHIRGAAAMGWWALPRTDPWFELMTTSLSGTDPAFLSAVAEIGAPWLARLPWRNSGQGPGSKSEQGGFEAALWSAAIELCQSWSEGPCTALVDAIADRSRTVGHEHAIAAWAASTRAILRGEAELDTGGALEHPVGVAIQLVLARSAPERYRTWARDRKTIPPAVWWTGALLTGALHGYRSLASVFRGGPRLRHFLAWRLSESPGEHDAALSWENSGGAVRFTVGGRVVLDRAETARGTWYRASLDLPANRQGAIELCRELGWPCVHQELIVRDEVITISGPGQLERRGQTLQANGLVRMSLPASFEVKEGLDDAAFRRCLVSRGGEVKHPPAWLTPDPLPGAAPSTRSGKVKHPPRRLAPDPLPGVAPSTLDREQLIVEDVPGLLYLRNFLSPEREQALIRSIDAAPWLDELKRRVQHYGWKYNYRARKVTRDMQIGPLPDWALEIAVSMAESGLMPWVADQVIVNEYVQNQGISKHIDCKPCFEEYIASISLNEAWHMRFREKSSKRRVDHLLERGSVVIMTGAARYDWTHEIPKRKTEPGLGSRSRRISLTFRRVKIC